MTRIRKSMMIDRTGQFPEGIGPPLAIAEQLEARRGTMSLSEFAQILTVSYFTIYKWVRELGLPATKIGGSYWIDPKLAARWWRDHSTAIAKPPASIRSRSARVANAG
jgi:excisionase family DNA binding protein